MSLDFDVGVSQVVEQYLGVVDGVTDISVLHVRQEALVLVEDVQNGLGVDNHSQLELGSIWQLVEHFVGVAWLVEEFPDFGVDLDWVQTEALHLLLGIRNSNLLSNCKQVFRTDFEPLSFHPL